MELVGNSAKVSSREGGVDLSSDRWILGLIAHVSSRKGGVDLSVVKLEKGSKALTSPPAREEWI